MKTWQRNISVVINGKTGEATFSAGEVEITVEEGTEREITKPTGRGVNFSLRESQREDNEEIRRALIEAIKEKEKRDQEKQTLIQKADTIKAALNLSGVDDELAG